MMKSNEVPDREGSTSICRTSSNSKARRTSESSLPEELIFIILSWIPADILYSCMRYVCKQWYNIIHSPTFMKQYQPSRVFGLFFARTGRCYFKSLEEPKARPTRLKLPSHYRYWGACDGLLLLERRRDEAMYIANPLTRRITALPPFRDELHHHILSFAYSHSAKEYKVFLTNYSLDQEAYEFGVLTLGRDCAWKLIHSPYLRGYLFINIMWSTLCIGEFIFWIDRGASYILCLCVESEAVFRLPNPTSGREGYTKTYLPGREFLSLIGGYEGGRYVDIWCLFDPKGVAGWRNMYKLDLGVQVPTRNTGGRNVPVAWVNNEVVILDKLFFSGPLLGYNVKTGETAEIEERKHQGTTFFSEFVCSFTWIALR